MRPIHLAHLDKTRPVLVLTRDIAIGWLRTVTVAAITSTVHGLATEVLLGAANGLDHDCAANLDNIFTVDHAALGRRIGHLLNAQERNLHNAIVSAFDLGDDFGPVILRRRS